MLSKIVGDWRTLLRPLTEDRPPSTAPTAGAAGVARLTSDATATPTSDRLDGYRQALEEHFCITVTDPNGRLLEVNDRFCKVVGYEASELIGQHYELLSSGMRMSETLEEMWETVHAGKTWRGELCDRAKNGADVCFESIVIPRFNRQGEIEQFITISTDITAIREQAQSLQAMIDNFPGGIALIDRELKLIASNRLYRTLLDLPDTLFAGSAPKLETLVRFRAERGDYGPLPVEDAVTTRLKTLLSPVPITTERNEFSGRTLEITCVPVHGGGHLNTYLDVTDRRRAENELKRAHSTLQAFIKHAPAAVAMFDTNMRYIAYTDRWLHDYNLPDKPLIGRSHYEVFPEIPDHWKAKHQRILRGATESSPEEVFKRADGSINIIRWEVRPWHLEDNSIGGMMMLTEEITERKRLEQQLWKLAKQDSLTGLPNRLLFNEQLEALLVSAAENHQRFAVGLIDVDRFKETNDILGHAAGDELLKEVGARLQGALAPYGGVARLGGDEFAVLISMHSDPSALSCAIDAMFAALKPPITLGGVQHRCTISLGLSLFPSDAKGVSELLKNADLALYRAKDLGRDRYQFYVPEMRASFETAYQLHRDIQRALNGGELGLLYQPIVSLEGSQPVCFEALLRWNDPRRGLLAPSDFEEIFDDPKSAADVGKWVIDQAVRQAAAWERSGLEFGRIAINVTSADFALGTFSDLVRSKLREIGVRPERLCIEVTERVFLGRSAVGVAVALQELHDLGVEIALDDFGTGFASLSHLKKLPIDRLKVDRSFVRDMETNPDNMAIVRTIAHLGQSLGIKVTVEGVETRSQLTLLRAMGCDTMQGYLFARPMDGSQVRAFIHRERALSA
ncbi:MAG: EAL domain-containing protein [Hyphomicrobium sp.]|uniref:sensor domain-containing protein n=1 Tax=Hyphomicrobium sp. TaxID=82 RepID=UPI0025BE6739|nr:EAL domain-containing protein [Hyphomicrobium sp.]MBZ0208594.1 EAL domain-containing protein [Hyphomicrobium sp.]